MRSVLLDQRIKKESKSREGKKSGGFCEYLVFFLFLSVFIILLMIQTDFIAPYFEKSDLLSDFDGVPLMQETYFFIPCSIKLRLTNLETCPDLRVLVNGIERESFTGTSIFLHLKEGDVVEFDASSLLIPAELVICSVSGSTKSLLGKTFYVTDGIVPVVGVRDYSTSD